MNRWTRHLLLSLPLLLAATLGAHAQAIVREVPPDARPARLAVGLPPLVTLDAQPERLSPGARIRDTRNLLVLPASLSGQELPAVYKRDPTGLVHEVWLLTEDEFARLRRR